MFSPASAAAASCSSTADGRQLGVALAGPANVRPCTASDLQQPEGAAAGDHTGQRLTDEQFDQAGGARDHAGVLFAEGKGSAGSEPLRRLGDERVVQARDLLDEGRRGVVARVEEPARQPAAHGIPSWPAAQLARRHPGLEPGAQTLSHLGRELEVSRQGSERNRAGGQMLQPAAAQAGRQEHDAVIVAGRPAYRGQYGELAATEERYEGA